MLMKKYFDKVATKKLQVFQIKSISDTVACFINKSDKESVKMIFE